jgi:dolichyl-phosphate-mannose-protein mannosyltransferase
VAQHSSLIKNFATGLDSAVWNRLFQETLNWQGQWHTLSGQPTSQSFVPCESFARVTVSRTELVAILVITVAGFAARFAFLNELAIEHFDEGVYASNLWFPDEGYQYPDRFLYAPPLLPSLIEWSMIFFGQARWVPFLPSLILGSLTVPLAWWSVRRWSSGASGVAAAGLLSLNDFHIAMSRSALTDAPMVFFLLLAVWLAVEALADRNLRLSAVAGFATGLTWAIKYNGWLPIAIAVSGSAAAWIFWPREKSLTKGDEGRLPAGSIVACLAVVTLTAVATWFPVWWELQPIGGYSRVADNHRNYVTGFAEWWPAATRHEAVQRHYAGWPTLLSGWLAVVCSALVFRVERSTWNDASPPQDDSNRGSIRADEQGVKRSTWNSENDTEQQLDKASAGASTSTVKRSTWNESRFINTALMTAALVGAVALSPVVALGIWSLIEFLASGKSVRRIHQRRLDVSSSKASDDKRRSKSRSKEATDSDGNSTSERARRSWFGVWLHLAWLCGLALATPLYRPYPRLILPLLCVGCVGTGLAIVRLLHGRLFNARSSSASFDATETLPQKNADSNDGSSEGELSSNAVANAESDPRPAAHSNWLRTVWLTLVVGLCLWRANDHRAPAWQNRAALAEIAEQAVAVAAENCKGSRPIKDDFTFVMYSYGEPGLMFHVANSGAPILPIMDLSFARPGSDHARIPTFVLAGPHAWKSSQFGDEFRALPEEAMIEVAEFPYRVSDFVLLDDHAPRQLSKHRDDVVKLYRVQFR